MDSCAQKKMTVVSIETSGFVTPIQSDQCDFPKQITYALARIAGRVGLLNELSRDARALLAEIVRCASTSQSNQAIRLSNEHFSKCLQMSVRTVCRLKADLEQGGWIERNQLQSRKHGMQILDIYLTPNCLKALGLVQVKPKRVYHLTSELESLTVLGLSKGSIVALMAKAKRKSLDLVSFVMRILTNVAKARNPYSYISKAIENYRPSKQPQTAKTEVANVKPMEKNNSKACKQWMKPGTNYRSTDERRIVLVYSTETDCIYQIDNDYRRVFLDYEYISNLIKKNQLAEHY